MLWLAAYLTGFPPVGLHALSLTHGLAPMWSGLYIISTSYSLIRLLAAQCRVNALSGLYIISTLHLMESTLNGQEHTVSMPSRAYTSFLRRAVMLRVEAEARCQCPLGLIPHFYDAIHGRLQ